VALDSRIAYLEGLISCGKDAVAILQRSLNDSVAVNVLSASRITELVDQIETNELNFNSRIDELQGFLTKEEASSIALQKQMTSLRTSSDGQIDQLAVCKVANEGQIAVLEVYLYIYLFIHV
jgi:hypothetical protein